ncbi:hypothetical protein RRG08_025907 [Elysia crispata]|uniref:Uncharacterized protein n=1 Tax=Elysia crispata TaxID=231223 RepID=A0AAE1DYC4_9GAST|nr:hypothetical protein RRG08_025907 [Elysia crispata]
MLSEFLFKRPGQALSRLPAVPDSEVPHRLSDFAFFACRVLSWHCSEAKGALSEARDATPRHSPLVIRHSGGRACRNKATRVETRTVMEWLHSTGNAPPAPFSPFSHFSRIRSPAAKDQENCGAKYATNASAQSVEFQKLKPDDTVNVALCSDRRL